MCECISVSIHTDRIKLEKKEAEVQVDSNKPHRRTENDDKYSTRHTFGCSQKENEADKGGNGKV